MLFSLDTPLVVAVLAAKKSKCPHCKQKEAVQKGAASFFSLDRKDSGFTKRRSDFLSGKIQKVHK